MTYQQLKTLCVEQGARDPTRVAASVSLAIIHGHRPPAEVFRELKRHQPELFRR